MLGSIEEALDLVGQFQDAALDSTLWNSSLNSLAKKFDSEIGNLTVGTIKPLTLVENVMAASIIPPADLEEKLNRLSPYDLRLQYGMRNPGKAFSCRQVLDEHEWTSNPFYQEILLPNGVPYTMVCMDVVDQHYAFSAGCLRGETQGIFRTEEVKQLDMLAPHMIRAVRTQIRLGQQRGVADDLRTALDLLVPAILLVDASGKVWFANRAAETILAKGDGLLVQHGRIKGSTPEVSNQIEALLGQMVQAACSSILPQNDAMSLPRRSGLPDLSLLCVPFSADRLATFPLRPSAMLFISDPAAEKPVPEDLITRMYGLTAGEARLCGDLLRGMDLAQHAEQHGISSNTAKTHLKNVFAKTDTHRQAELIRLILSGPMGHAVLDNLNRR